MSSYGQYDDFFTWGVPIYLTKTLITTYGWYDDFFHIMGSCGLLQISKLIYFTCTLNGSCMSSCRFWSMYLTKTLITIASYGFNRNLQEPMGTLYVKKSHRIGHRRPYEAIVISFFVKYVLIEIYGNPCKPLSKNIIVSSIGTHTMQ